MRAVAGDRAPAGDTLMCLACIEAELWLAYQEDLVSRQAAAAGAAGAAGPDPVATEDAPPDRRQAPFVCEEPPAT